MFVTKLDFLPVQTSTDFVSQWSRIHRLERGYKSTTPITQEVAQFHLCGGDELLIPHGGLVARDYFFGAPQGFRCLVDFGVGMDRHHRRLRGRESGL